jgi:hypothetical protein
MTQDGLAHLARWFGGIYRVHTNPANLETWGGFFADYGDTEILDAAEDLARLRSEHIPTVAQIRARAYDRRGGTPDRARDSAAPFVIREAPALADPDHPLSIGIPPAGWNPMVWLRSLPPRARSESVAAYAARIKAKERWLPWITMEQLTAWID